jgi:hypothetical protein
MRPASPIARTLLAAITMIGIVGCPGHASDEDTDTSDGPAPCPAFGTAEQVAVVQERDIDEASGLAMSVLHADVLWTHNDSGDSARVFAVGTTGELRGAFLMEGVQAIDFEDIARHVQDDGTSWLYVGDIGDNNTNRSGVVVYGFAEPATLSGTAQAPTPLAVEAYPLLYPDGAHDAETLLVEPSGDLVIVTKSRSGASGVYRVEAPHTPGVARTLTKVADLQLGTETIPGDLMVTGGDLTPDGRTLVLRTYLNVWLWPIGRDEPLEQALRRAPCRPPSPPEPQGEAIAFDLDPPTYWTLSEGRNQPLYRVPVVPTE